LRKTLPAFRELRRCEGGLAAIEFAMIALPMMMTLLGLIEFGRGLYLYNRISHVADLATRRVLTHPDTADQVLTDQISAEFSRHEAAPSSRLHPEASAPAPAPQDFAPSRSVRPSSFSCRR
jgi:hypothetical protein